MTRIDSSRYGGMTPLVAATVMAQASNILGAIRGYIFLMDQEISNYGGATLSANTISGKAVRELQKKRDEYATVLEQLTAVGLGEKLPSISSDLGREALHRLTLVNKDYLGVGEFAYVLDISKQAFANRRMRDNQRHPIPNPIGETNAGPIWTRVQVLKHIKGVFG